MTGGLLDWLPRPKSATTAKATPRVVALELLCGDAHSNGRVRQLLARLSTDLDLDLRLAALGGDIVVIEEGLVDRSIWPLVQSVAGGRPALRLPADALQHDPVRAAMGLQKLRQELLQAIEGLAVPPAAPPASQDSTEPDTVAAETGFDLRIADGTEVLGPNKAGVDPEQQLFLNAIQSAVLDPSAAPVVATYADGGVLWFDFHQGVLVAEPLALERLRRARELPFPSPGAFPDGDVECIELDLALWDLGRAAGVAPLAQAPVDAWYRPLAATQIQTLRRYTQLPLHLEMGRRLADHPHTPSELRRVCRCTAAEVRSFVQAGLYLQLLHWLDPQPDGA